MKKLIVFALSTLFLCSCVQQQRHSLSKDEPVLRESVISVDATRAAVKSTGVEIHLSPVCTRQMANYRPSPGVLVRCPQNAFELIITNKTKDDIEVVWNESMFVKGDQTDGGFMFEGVVYSKRAEQKPNDVVFPGATFKRTIWPNSLAIYIEVMGLGWQNQPFGLGEFGAYVVIKTPNRQIKQRLMTGLSLQN